MTKNASEMLATLLEPRARLARTLLFLVIGLAIAYVIYSVFSRVQLVQTPAQDAALANMRAAKSAYDADVASLMRLRGRLATVPLTQQRRLGHAYMKASQNCLLAVKLYADAATGLNSGFIAVRRLPGALEELPCR